MRSRNDKNGKRCTVAVIAGASCVSTAHMYTRVTSIWAQGPTSVYDRRPFCSPQVGGDVASSVSCNARRGVRTVVSTVEKTKGLSRLFVVAKAAARELYE